jgi:stress response protein YsnF
VPVQREEVRVEREPITDAKRPRRRLGAVAMGAAATDMKEFQ